MVGMMIFGTVPAPGDEVSHRLLGGTESWLKLFEAVVIRIPFPAAHDGAKPLWKVPVRVSNQLK